MANPYSRSNGYPNAGSGRSRFMNNFDGSSTFQNGVSHNIWAAGDPQSDRAELSEHDTGSATLNGTPSFAPSSTTHPNNSDSYGALLLNGSTPLAQDQTFELTQSRQRNLPSTRSMQADGVPALTSTLFPSAPSLNPTAGSFSQGNVVEPFQAPFGSSSRDSSRVRHGSFGLDNGVSFWNPSYDTSINGFSRAPSQAVSRSNSQAVSRNNSLPPSRHGGGPSPTEPSFSLPFSSVRSGPYSSDRPPSQGQYSVSGSSGHRGPRLSGMQPARNSSQNGATFSPEDLNSAVVGRNDSIGSASAFTSASEQFAQLNMRDAGDSPSQIPSRLTGHYGDQARPHLTAVFDTDNFPRLSNDASRPNGWVFPRSGGSGFLARQRAPQGLDPTFSNRSTYSFDAPPASQNRNVISYGYLPTQQEMYANGVADYQQYVRPGYRHGSQMAMRPHTQANRNAYDHVPAQAPDLVVGRNWREQERQNGAQRFIETGPETSLRDVLGHVARFCGDQNGSRFLQDKLEEANTEEKELIFQELIRNTIQLCSDPFGNYVIQKFFELGTQRQKEQLAGKMQGKVRDLSTNMYGCRCVQKAFEHVLCDQQAVLVRELKPCLLEVSKDQHGNHVVQKAIGRLPREDIQFILNGYTGKVREMSHDAYGCRVIQRLLEVDDDPAMKSRLIEEVHRCSVDLIRNSYGNYVVQHVIDHGTQEDRSRLITAIVPFVVDLTNNKYASNVVEKCLRLGSEEERDRLIAKLAELDTLTGKPRHLKSAMLSNFGNYVIQKILKILTAPKWSDFAVLVGGQVDEMMMMGDKNVEKKAIEFRRLLQEGARDPNTTVDDAINRRESRQPHACNNMGTQQPQKAARRTKTASIEDGSNGIAEPPPLDLIDPSPSTSSTPSTSDGAVGVITGLNTTPTSPKGDSPVPLLSDM